MILKTIKEKMFLRRLNNRIKRYGAKASIVNTNGVTSTLAIHVKNDFTHITIGENNYNKMFIKLVENEVVAKRIKQNTERGIPIEK